MTSVHYLPPGSHGFLSWNDSGWISIASRRRLSFICPGVANHRVLAPTEECRWGHAFRLWRCTPSVIPWVGVGNILSSVQARETCRATEEHAESTVTPRVKEQWLPSSPDRCVVVTQLCHLAAFSFVIYLDSQPLPGLLRSVVRAVCLCVAAWWVCDQCGWAVELYSAMTGCWGALGLILWQTFSFSVSLCLGMSLNCQAEPAWNSRLDVLYTCTFTSEDVMFQSKFTSGNVALN